LGLCTAAGFAISQVRPEYIQYNWAGALIGFGFGWLMIAIDEMLKGFSLRAFPPPRSAFYWETSARC